MSSLDTAKSRLSSLGDIARPELALAMLLDTLTAAVHASVQVRVVTPDAEVGRALDGSGLTVGRFVSEGSELNTDLRAAISQLRPGPAAILPADLPALRPAALTRALSRAADLETGVQGDAAGRGTTLLAAVDGRELQPSFGPGSLARHVRSGARLLPPDPYLAHDVDVPADLHRVVALGVGRRTREVLERLGVADADRPVSQSRDRSE